MLNTQHFYHRITRKMVAAFGTIFNDIRLVRYNLAGTQEIERITVPISYMAKEKFFQRTTVDPELTRETGINLPRMSFELVSITYDPLRKTSAFGTLVAPNTATGTLKTVKTAPYNFDFNLSLYVRNTEDGTQIIEQILPYFSPDYTVTLELVDLEGINVDVPIILNSVSYSVMNDSDIDNVRVLNWDLSFTAKAYLYGPISDSKIIKHVKANTFYFNTSSASIKQFQMTNGSGNFKTGELIYDGKSLSSASATAFVDSWSPTTNTLIVVDSVGTFPVGNTFSGAVTNATWNIGSVTNGDYKISAITVDPNPYTANVNDDYGFTTNITEY